MRKKGCYPLRLYKVVKAFKGVTKISLLNYMRGLREMKGILYERLKKHTYKIISVDVENYLPSKIFDVFIMVLIAINVLLVILDTFKGFSENTRNIFRFLEVLSVVIFSIEYVLRVWTANYIYEDIPPLKAQIKYILSFMAVIDLLAILPFYLPYLIPIDLRVLRLVRLLRLLRILKVNRYTGALSTIGSVLRHKASQLISSIFVVFLLMIIASILMYSIENEAQPNVFENAFSGLWWAVATFTTVGYGDIYPVTILGKVLSSVIAMLGIGLVAVPTGIISAGFVEQMEDDRKNDFESISYCPYCGKKLN